MSRDGGFQAVRAAEIYRFVPFNKKTDYRKMRGLFHDLVESTLLASGKIKKKKEGNLVHLARGQADTGSAAVYTTDWPVYKRPSYKSSFASCFFFAH
jgi:hypothetical protein